MLSSPPGPPGKGWVSFAEAQKTERDDGCCRLGWRRGPKATDLPVLVTTSSRAERLAAMTWHDDTYSLIHNPQHPCMHADPCFRDLAPGERAAIAGLGRSGGQGYAVPSPAVSACPRSGSRTRDITMPASNSR